MVSNPFTLKLASFEYAQVMACVSALNTALLCRHLLIAVAAQQMRPLQVQCACPWMRALGSTMHATITLAQMMLVSALHMPRCSQPCAHHTHSARQQAAPSARR